MKQRPPRRSPPAPRRPPRGATPRHAFDVEAFLASTGLPASVVEYRAAQSIFAQGDACDTVRYLERGMVRLWVVSRAEREGVIALLGPGDFFGEGCLTGQPAYPANATAVTASRVLAVPRDPMLEVLHSRHEMSSRFIAHLLARNIRIGEDLVDQMFHSVEQRLARALLLLASLGVRGARPSADMRPIGIHPLSQESLAEMAGTTRARVTLLMRRFERRGLIEYRDGLQVHHPLLTALLRN